MSGKLQSLTNVLRGVTGELEINRVVGAFGSIAYIIGANGFVAWNMAKGQHFDVTAYCLAFPTGLGVAVGSIAGAVAWKDQKVANARVTEQTNAIAAPPPDGPPAPLEGRS